MVCLFEIYNRYYDAAEAAASDGMDALWDEVAELRTLESMAGAQALEDRQMKLPRCGQLQFCRLHQGRRNACPKLARDGVSCA